MESQLDPLLNEQDAPWNLAGEAADLESAGPGGANTHETELPKTVKELLSSHPDEVLKHLQNDGVIKVGEFSVSSDIALPAFKGRALLTLGREHQTEDIESMWRTELKQRAEKERRGRDGWSNDVIVEAFVVNITGAADPDADGLVHPLLRRYQGDGCGLEVFGIPAMQGVIEFKWNTFARYIMFTELGFFLLWLLSFLSFTWLFQDEDLELSLGKLLQTRRGVATVVSEFIAVAAMTPFLMLEQGTFRAYGWRGWLNVWNGIDILTYGLQITVTIMHLGRIGLKSNILSVLLAAQVLLLLFKLQFFTRCFTSTRFSFVEAIRDVVMEIRQYFLFLIVIVFGFSAAFHILFRQDQSVSHFDTLPHSFVKVYGKMLDGLEFDELLDSHVPVAASILNVVYAFVMGMVLMNLLIGIMTNALERVTEHEALKLLLHKAEIIDELEVLMPRWLENKFDKEWYPKYIHCLRIDRDRMDKPDLQMSWDRPSQDENIDMALKETKSDAAVKGSKKLPSEDVEQLQRKIDALAKQLTRLETLLTAEKK